MEKPVVEVKFFLEGDETGAVHEMSFNTHKEYDEWHDDMNKSIELFSVRYLPQ